MESSRRKAIESCDNPEKYSLSEKEGKFLYQSMSDEELLDILREEAKELGHSPSQKELFWIWRDYIKTRFKRWPYALTKAGLSKSAGKCGKSLEDFETEKKEYQTLLAEIRVKAEELGRIPHPKDLPEVCIQLQKYTSSWNGILKDAGITEQYMHQHATCKIDDLEPEYLAGLQEIKSLANMLGRSPLRSEVNPELKNRLVERCGSYRNVLFQIGLEPVIRMNPFSATKISKHRIEKESGERSQQHRNTLYDCYYQVLNPDRQTVRDLELVKEIAEKLGHLPEKQEVPTDVRKRLQEACGSWSNTLFQIEEERDHD